MKQIQGTEAAGAETPLKRYSAALRPWRVIEWCALGLEFFASHGCCWECQSIGSFF